jgi:hypothetical protein
MYQSQVSRTSVQRQLTCVEHLLCTPSVHGMLGCKVSHQESPCLTAPAGTAPHYTVSTHEALKHHKALGDHVNHVAPQESFRQGVLASPGLLLQNHMRTTHIAQHVVSSAYAWPGSMPKETIWQKSNTYKSPPEAVTAQRICVKARLASPCAVVEQLEEVSCCTQHTTPAGPSLCGIHGTAAQHRTAQHSTAAHSQLGTAAHSKTRLAGTA